MWFGLEIHKLKNTCACGFSYSCDFSPKHKNVKNHQNVKRANHTINSERCEGWNGSLCDYGKIVWWVKTTGTRIVPFVWILNQSSYKMNTLKSHVRDGTTGLQKNTWHDFFPVDLSKTSIETRMTWFWFYWNHVFFGNHVISTWNKSVVKTGIMWCLRQVKRARNHVM